MAAGPADRTRGGSGGALLRAGGQRRVVRERALGNRGASLASWPWRDARRPAGRRPDSGRRDRPAEWGPLSARPPRAAFVVTTPHAPGGAGACRGRPDLIERAHAHGARRGAAPTTTSSTAHRRLQKPTVPGCTGYGQCRARCGTADRPGERRGRVHAAGRKTLEEAKAGQRKADRERAPVVVSQPGPRHVGTSVTDTLGGSYTHTVGASVSAGHTRSGKSVDLGTAPRYSAPRTARRSLPLGGGRSQVGPGGPARRGRASPSLTAGSVPAPPGGCPPRGRTGTRVARPNSLQRRAKKKKKKKTKKKKKKKRKKNKNKKKKKTQTVSRPSSCSGCGQTAMIVSLTPTPRDAGYWPGDCQHGHRLAARLGRRDDLYRR